MDDRGAGCGKAACPVLRGAGGNSDKDEAPDADGEPYGEQKLKYPIVRGASSLLEPFQIEKYLKSYKNRCLDGRYKDSPC